MSSLQPSRLSTYLLEPLTFLLSLTPLSRFLTKQDHFAPHPDAPFEGYYTRIVTTDGATILLIFSSVFSAVEKPHLVHFSYLPPRNHGERIVLSKFPQITDVAGALHADGVREFSSQANGDGVAGSYTVSCDEQRYHLEFAQEGVDVDVLLTERTPWVAGDVLSTPEGVWSRLVHSLPLHWNVFSTASRAEYKVLQHSRVVSAGVGIAHMEKNWGVSFPSGWTWIQGFSGTGERTFCLAGGSVLGTKAFLVGYRSEHRKWSFLPLETVVLFGMMKEDYDSRLGVARFVVGGVWRRLSVEVKAPAEHEGWLGLPCPLRDGHGNTFAYESFEGSIKVRAYERGWSMRWELVEETMFEGAAVEFGGNYSYLVRKKDR